MPERSTADSYVIALDQIGVIPLKAGDAEVMNSLLEESEGEIVHTDRAGISILRMPGARSRSNLSQLAANWRKRKDVRQAGILAPPLVLMALGSIC